MLNTQQKRRLLDNKNPDDNTPMARPGRRLTWEDIGGSTVDQAVEAYRMAQKEAVKKKNNEKEEAAKDEEEKARAEFGDSWHAYTRDCGTAGLFVYGVDAQCGEAPVEDQWCW